MTRDAGTDALIRDLAVARLRLEGGQLPDDMDGLLDRLDAMGIENLATLPEGVRGLLDEGASAATLAMIATSFSLAEVYLRLHPIEPGKSP